MWSIKGIFLPSPRSNQLWVCRNHFYNTFCWTYHILKKEISKKVPRKEEKIPVWWSYRRSPLFYFVNFWKTSLVKSNPYHIIFQRRCKIMGKVCFKVFILLKDCCVLKFLKNSWISLDIFLVCIHFFFKILNSILNKNTLEESKIWQLHHKIEKKIFRKV